MISEKGKAMLMARVQELASDIVLCIGTETYDLREDGYSELADYIDELSEIMSIEESDNDDR